MRKMVSAALMSAAVMVSGPAQAVVNLDFSFADQDGRGVTRGTIFNVGDNGEVAGSTASIFESPIFDAVRSYSFANGGVTSTQTFNFVFDNGQVVQANAAYQSDGTAGALIVSKGDAVTQYGDSYVRDGGSDITYAALNSTNFTIVPVAPGAPGPLAGLGLLPALAGVGSLIATRARRRKVAAA